MKNSVLVKNQVKTFSTEGFRIDGGHGKLVVKVRYDDNCGNGRNSFGITGELYRDEIDCGSVCIHDDIAKYMPELSHLIKWHLMSSDEPMHYVSNTMYHACDTDYNGLRKGEYGSYEKCITTSDIIEGDDINIYTSGQIYLNRQNNPNLKKVNDKEELLISEFISKLKVKYNINQVNQKHSLSEGNEPNLKAARNSAIWENATLEQLQSKELLKARLPALREEFMNVVESLGMIY